MSRTFKVEVDQKVFRWLRESSGWTKEEVAKRLGVRVELVEAIEAGSRQPTLRQLKELSNAYKRPLATFLLSEPLEELPLPKDYRMLPGRTDVFHKKTIYAIRKARSLQDVSAEMLINFNDSMEPRVKRAIISDNPEAAASTYRKAFELSIEVQEGFKTGYDIFNHLRSAIEAQNVLVFQLSMPVEDARGFALTDGNPNAVIINSADSIEARTFTLMHEFGHVLLGETAIDMPDVAAGTTHKVENWCNSFASEFLLPKELAKEAFKSEGGALTEPKTLGKLSRRYKVSKGMLSYKMYKLNFITKPAYEGILARYVPGKDRKSVV